MKKISVFMLGIAVIAVFSVLTGCQKDARPVVEIEGTATWEGKPIPKGFSLEFSPDNKGNGGRVSNAPIEESGKFIALYTNSKDGVERGPVTVRVMFNTGFNPPPPEEYLPMIKKYGQKSEGIKMEITKKDKNFKVEFP